MNYATRQNAFARACSALDRLLKRHPFVMLSALAHVVALSLLYYFGSYQVAVAQQAAMVSQSVQRTSQMSSQTRTAKRVQDMEKIKSLMEQSRAEHAAEASTRPQDDEVDFEATSLPKKPEELLAEARALAESIDDIAKDLKAEDMAKLLKIPKKEAREQLEAASKPIAPPALDDAAAAPASDSAQLAQAIESLEQQAREALAERARALERQEQGVSVNTDPLDKSVKDTDRNRQAAQTGSASQLDKLPVRPAMGQGGASNGAGQNGGGGGGGGDGDDHGIRGQMAHFINRDKGMPRNAKNDDWALQRATIASQHAAGYIPARKAVKGTGRLFGAGGEYAERVFVNSWYVIGPFDSKHGYGVFHNRNYSYPPEQAVLLDAVYIGKDQRLLKWQYVSDASYPLIPQDAEVHAVYYGYTELMMDEARDITMSIGADDEAQIWLNDKLVWINSGASKNFFFMNAYVHQRDLDMTEGMRRVHFKKGRNKLLFKLSNGTQGTFFSMVLSK